MRLQLKNILPQEIYFTDWEGNNKMGLFSPPKIVKWNKYDLDKSRRQVERIYGDSLWEKEWVEIRDFVAELFEEDDSAQTHIQMKRHEILLIVASMRYDDEDEITQFVEKRLATLYGVYTPDIE